MADSVQSGEKEAVNAHPDVENLAEIPIDEPTKNIAPPQEGREVSTHAQKHEEQSWIENTSAGFGQDDTPAQRRSYGILPNVDDLLPESKGELQGDDECHK